MYSEIYLRLEPLGLERVAAAGPKVFELLQRGAGVDEDEMRRTFNQGIGFVFIVPQVDEGRVVSVLRGLGDQPVAMGRVVRVSVADGSDADARLTSAGGFGQSPGRSQQKLSVFRRAFAV